MTPRTRPALSAAHGEPEQVPRLQAFRGAHPDVEIEPIRGGLLWRAWIKEEGGETVAVRRRLADLLDRLDVLLSGTCR